MHDPALARGQPWNPAQYGRFSQERSQPFFDLMSLVEQRGGMRIVDLGCGTGALTADLHRAMQASATIGVDSSASMLAEAARHAMPGLSFLQRDLREFAAQAEHRGAFDLVLSNAALQWVPEQART